MSPCIQVRFLSASQPPCVLKPLRVRGREALNEPYRYDLLLAFEGEPPADRSLLQAPCTLDVEGEGQRLCRHGVLASLEVPLGRRRDAPPCPCLRARLVPRLWRLSWLRACRIHADPTLAGLLRNLLGEAGLEGEDLDLQALGERRPLRAFRWQYQESGLAFLERLCEDEGITWHFRQEPRREVLCFTDDTRALGRGRPPARLLLLPEGPAVLGGPRPPHLREFQRLLSPLPAELHYRAFQPQRPGQSLDLRIPLPGGGAGVHLEQGECCENLDEARLRARLRAEALACRADLYKGGGWAALGAGEPFRLALEGGEGAPEEAVYLPLAVTQELDLARGGTWRTHLDAIPLEVPHRPLRRTPMGRTPGPLHGRVAGSPGTEPAELDPQGRSRVQLPQDIPEGPDVWLPRLQPSGGPDHGMHLPLRPGADLLLAPLHGDPEQLVILGALPTQENPSLVRQENRDRGRIRSASGAEIRFSEGAGRTALALGQGGAAGGSGLHLGSGLLRTWSGGDQVQGVLGTRLDLTGAWSLALYGGQATQVSLLGDHHATLGVRSQAVLGHWVEAQPRGDRICVGTGRSLSFWGSGQLLCRERLILAAGGFLGGEPGHLVWGAFGSSLTSELLLGVTQLQLDREGSPGLWERLAQGEGLHGVPPPLAILAKGVGLTLPLVLKGMADRLCRRLEAGGAEEAAAQIRLDGKGLLLRVAPEAPPPLVGAAAPAAAGVAPADPLDALEEKVLEVAVGEARSPLGLLEADPREALRAPERRASRCLRLAVGGESELCLDPAGLELRAGSPEAPLARLSLAACGFARCSAQEIVLSAGVKGEQPGNIRVEEAEEVCIGHPRVPGAGVARLVIMATRLASLEAQRVALRGTEDLALHSEGKLKLSCGDDMDLVCRGFFRCVGKTRALRLEGPRVLLG